MDFAYGNREFRSSRTWSVDRDDEGWFFQDQRRKQQNDKQEFERLRAQMKEIVDAANKH